MPRRWLELKLRSPNSKSKVGYVSLLTNTSCINTTAFKLLHCWQTLMYWHRNFWTASLLTNTWCIDTTTFKQLHCWQTHHALTPQLLNCVIVNQQIWIFLFKDMAWYSLMTRLVLWHLLRSWKRRELETNYFPTRILRKNWNSRLFKLHAQ